MTMRDRHATHERVVGCIYAAIDEANRDRGDEPPLERSLETPIHGTESSLDSLGLVNFVVAVEEKVEQELDVPLVLGDDRALSRDPSPFESVGALADYVVLLLDERE